MFVGMAVDAIHSTGFVYSRRYLESSSADGRHHLDVRVEIKSGIRLYPVTTMRMSRAGEAESAYKVENGTNPSHVWVQPDGLVWLFSNSMPGPGQYEGLLLLDRQGKLVGHWTPNELPGITIDPKDRHYAGRSGHRGATTSDLVPEKTRFESSKGERAAILVDAHGCEFRLSFKQTGQGLWQEQDIKALLVKPVHGKTEVWPRRMNAARDGQPYAAVNADILD